MPSENENRQMLLGVHVKRLEGGPKTICQACLVNDKYLAFLDIYGMSGYPRLQNRGCLS